MIRRGSSFIQPNFIGNGVLLSGGNCNYSIYSDGTTQFRVPFVEQDTQLPVIISFDGNYVDNGQVPKLNTLDDITVVWYDATATLITDTEPVVAHEFATIVNITRGGKTRPYSHKTSAGVVDLLYYRNDAGQVVYFDGDYTIPLSVTSPVTFGYSLTNGNVSGAVIAEFEQALTAGQSNDVIIPEFTDDWGNEILLADRTTAVMYEDAVYIVSPIDGYKTNLLLVPVEWVNNAGTTVNDDEVIASHEFATDVDITRGTAPNTDTVTISHKDGVPIASLLYYRDDLGVRVDFNGTYTVPETVTSPVTLGWSITNGNVSGEVEQTEFDEVLTIGANSVVLPAFTDDWGNSVAIGDRTFSVTFGSAGVQPRNYWKMTEVVGGEVVDEMGVDNILVIGAPSFDASGMEILQTSDGAVTKSTNYQYMPLDSDWTIEYTILLGSSANIFSGYHQVGKWPPFGNPRTGITFVGNNNIKGVLYGRELDVEPNGTVATWRNDSTPINIRIGWDSLNKTSYMTINGTNYTVPSSLSTIDTPMGQMSIGISSTSNTEFIAGTSSGRFFKYSEIKYYDQLID